MVDPQFIDKLKFLNILQETPNKGLLGFVTRRQAEIEREQKERDTSDSRSEDDSLILGVSNLSPDFVGEKKEFEPLVSRTPFLEQTAIFPEKFLRGQKVNPFLNPDIQPNPLLRVDDIRRMIRERQESKMARDPLMDHDDDSSDDVSSDTGELRNITLSDIIDIIKIAVKGLAS